MSRPRIVKPSFAFGCMIIFISLLLVIYAYCYVILSSSKWSQFISIVALEDNLKLRNNVVVQTEISGIVRQNASPEQYNIMFLFNEALNSKQLQKNFKVCILSMLSRASKPPVLHITGDIISYHIAKNILHNLHYDNVKVIHHDKSEMPDNVFQTISNVHGQLSAVIHHFSDPIFYISLVMHRIVPVNVTRLILLDVDLIFQSDIIDLFSLFNNFHDDQAIGIARENQPVYRNVFWNYRKKHPDTKVGDPPPSGLTGFNSGVVLFELKKLRQSSIYNSFLDQDNLLMLVRKYEFKGHLGDQDFFTLLSFEHESLFYILPCGWNRQLCTWWQRDEFIPIFHRYYSCNEHIHIWHGNCNTSRHR